MPNSTCAPLSTYVVAIGSNRRGRHGAPQAQVAAAIRAIGDVVATAPIFTTAPVGPSIRRFANSAVLLETSEDPPELLARLKAIERDFGRRLGQRWGARVIDLDIILWSGGAWGDAGLTIPHIDFRERRFVLDPLARIAPDWRDPITGLTVRQLVHRLRAVDQRASRP
ncbi:2-amino-4-hydroxy-6-hydroxymethyldihydropteridine diphosphokinase [Sphingomonas sp. So64.6b]|uniref:2-amino-4-hydroxy-6- hydroxymethyldihydropteridine diphosphokinase n=1 Tax=Sphingomonas sp. So64.6b TaxID=2997354 RepID=UPI0015FEBC73|nr:2-amino-4-hydroxy-6-hydroxymethyldihydropteridine diphosphokinase [Sphingomonas sp. So64.6b]QNA86113.1 2-amino-4-hydroxy-6-hydroxymethyldihydropteridine diphosphokinase [Sphingomonas sp. So64.6b]